MQAAADIEAFNSLLRRWREGDRDAMNELVGLVHNEVEVIASSILQRHPAPRSIVTGDLVNEAFLKVIQAKELVVESRAHFIALCARIMRFILVDDVRRRVADKRKADVVTLTASCGGAQDPAFEALALSEALLRLQAISPERASIVEMRYFGGMSLDDIAEVTGVSPATIKRSWSVTRAWLKEAIGNGIA